MIRSELQRLEEGENKSHLKAFKYFYWNCAELFNYVHLIENLYHYAFHGIGHLIRYRI